ncbi:ferrous iron transporter A [Enterococcus saigonensis]|uniref:Ferrous iron transporter A n=1 Tax=Enterococcus saigonensis TaxID=1805431 RepID=A0A679IDW3_9ENTE|nr:ferrous iron transport protein A [Enterococcus saigonensis]BCA86373.1 ferrous iron transporter A [Enterococcus saigonensis]
MKKLAEVKANQPFVVKEVTASVEVQKHLQNLGLLPGSQVVLLKSKGQDGIVLVQNARLALDQSLLEAILVEPATEKREILSLDQLGVGDKGKVIKIFGEGAVKRRLMDMGLTKNVLITVRKLAPLGDPIEINLRGYELSLRKSEAEYILVALSEEG